MTSLLGIFFLVSNILIEARPPWPGAREPLQKQKRNELDQIYYANARPYLDEPLRKIRREVPELDSLRPAADDQALPNILGRTAGNVDDFFHHIVDLIAAEEVTQKRLNELDVVTRSQRTKDSYLLLFHGNGSRTDLEEYRMDAKGDRMDLSGVNEGYLVTFGFALICDYFSTALQPESRFRYLGDERIGSRETYVIAFAQRPGVATLHTSLASANGRKIDMLMQGIAWVDKSDFQILRMRTDLLAPRREVALDRQTTEVTFSKVQLPEIAVPLWLPAEVKVYFKYKAINAVTGGIAERRYLNEHRYSDYRRYRVSVKMVVPK